MKKSFKVVIGYDKFIAIGKSELPKAYYAFITDAKFIADSGECWAGKIMGIEPNWHAVMGWNEGYKPDGTALRSIGSKKRSYAESLMQGAINLAKEANQTKDLSLLKKPFIEQIGSGEDIQTEKLAAKMSVNK